jgi:hypothetical protein
MRTAITFSLLLALAAFGSISAVNRSTAQTTVPGGGRKPPEVRVLGQEAKLGTVTFSHIDHITKNRNLAGTAPMACIECHHTAQPAAEAGKHPPLKTAWPADRTSTLTIDQFDKDPQAPEVVLSRLSFADRYKAETPAGDSADKIGGRDGAYHFDKPASVSSQLCGLSRRDSEDSQGC